ncbi:MAG: nucleotide exchange factor GrpE [Chloroflexota bacterium]
MTERPTNGAPEDAPHARGPSRAALIQQLEDMQRVLDETREQSDEHLRGLQRTAADFANYRRRVDEEREGLSQFSNALLIGKLLAVLDDFDRALENVPKDIHEGWVDGVRLVERKLRGLLEAEGVTQIEALGQPFDPNLHEAVVHEETEDHPDNQVIAELQRGYRLRDRVLRPSLVRVANNPKEH